MFKFHDEELGVWIETETAEQFQDALRAHQTVFHDLPPTAPLDEPLAQGEAYPNVASNQQSLYPGEVKGSGDSKNKLWGDCMHAIAQGKHETAKPADPRNNFKFFLDACVAWEKNYTGPYTHAASQKWIAERLCQMIETPEVLERSELYQQRMVAISMAAMGYWTKGQSINADYRTPAHEQVADLYQRHLVQIDKLRAAQAPNKDAIQQVQQYYLEQGYTDEISTLKNQREQLAKQCEELKAHLATAGLQITAQANNVQFYHDRAEDLTKQVAKRDEQLVRLNKKLQKAKAKLANVGLE